MQTVECIACRLKLVAVETANVASCSVLASRIIVVFILYSACIIICSPPETFYLMFPLLTSF